MSEEYLPPFFRSPQVASLSPCELKAQSTIDSLRRSLRESEHNAATYKRAWTACKEDREQIKRKLVVTEKALNIRREMTPKWSFRIGQLVIGWGRK